jgi:hypothetical protein
VYSHQPSLNHVIFWPFDASSASRKFIKIGLVDMSHEYVKFEVFDV